MDTKQIDSIYLDCFSGISGDMFLGAMFDLGYPKKEFYRVLSLLNIPDSYFQIFTDHRKNIQGTCIKFNNIDDLKISCPHSHFSEIKSMIISSGLNQNIKNIAIRIFESIAQAEAKIHGMDISDITFHEIGAIDSIIDIIGAASVINFFKNTKFISAIPRLGHGFVSCRHGVYPIPSPATLEILKGIPTIQDINQNRELITPTGAAILATCCVEFGAIPQGKILDIGYGIGTYDDHKTPNILRILSIKQLSNIDPSDIVQIVETEIDDMNPEWLSYLMDELFEQNALDVYFSSIYMKKNRPGILLTILCDKKDLNQCIETIFKNSTSFGLRFRECKRIILDRRIIEINTPYGKSKIKIGYFNKNQTCISPEYEACKTLCRKAGISIKTAYEITLKSYNEQGKIDDSFKQ